ncbi:CpaE family protein [Sphingopyxis alaskensis]|uniref:AAA family ATPase n=1 Tax=Sphingopyxis alaskensis TaxID=117207 RepID=UPI00203F6B3B|nr:AAA family ATPase [Sphingopyxis alaskensis]MCM3417812.1 AAA family ATPase [Sphingopyxis alaskensis]
MDCKVKLFISEDEFARSSLSRGDYSDESLGLVHVAADAPLPLHLVGDAELVVVELPGGDPRSMQRLTTLRAQRPTLPLIVAMRGADLATTRALIRQGVDDVIALPLDRTEFSDAVNGILAKAIRIAEKGEKLAPVVAVAQSVGGIGATTVATHLAHHLGERSGARGTCLIDLDLQFGNAASYLGANPSLTMDDLLAAGQRVDGQLLRTVAAPGGDRVAVIAAPERIAPLETVDTDQLLRVLDVARREYDHVVLDLPGNWANWTLSAIDKADIILLVVDLSVGSLRQARRRLTLFEETGIDPARIRIVANRVEKRLFRTIGVREAADTLHYPVMATISSDYPVVQSAHDQGVLVSNIARRNRVAVDLAALAAGIADQLDKE